MKFKYLLIFIALFSFLGCAQTVKVSDLPATTSIDGRDLFMVVHGSTSSKVTFSDFLTNLYGTSGTYIGNITGNAGSVTNGVYTTGSYANPSWLGSLAGTKIVGEIPNVAYTNENNTFLNYITFSHTIGASINGNAETVTNGVYTNGSYANPSWITSLNGQKITGIINNVAYANSSNTFSGDQYFTAGAAFGGAVNITGQVWSSLPMQTSITGNAATVTLGLYSNNTYNNPSWLGQLAGTKITGIIPSVAYLNTANTFVGNQTITGGLDVSGNANFNGNNFFANNEFGNSSFDYGATFQDACNFYNMSSKFWMGFTSEKNSSFTLGITAHDKSTLDTVYIGREYLIPSIQYIAQDCSFFGHSLIINANNRTSYLQITGGGNTEYGDAAHALSINTMSAGKDGEMLTIEYDGDDSRYGMNFVAPAIVGGVLIGNIKLKTSPLWVMSTVTGSNAGSSVTFIYSHGFWRELYTSAQ
jgi:hypothetical protein